MERLNDKETLTYIALNDRARDARLAALHKLEDTDVLFKVAMHDPASLVRTTAIKMLDQKEMTDEELKAMLEAAQEDKIGEARIFIVKRIDDKEELIRIITHDPIEKVRLTALGKINDQESLIDIAKNNICAVP